MTAQENKFITYCVVLGFSSMGFLLMGMLAQAADFPQVGKVLAGVSIGTCLSFVCMTRLRRHEQ